MSDETGGSLPAVLVTISVGAILLAPFLAHVSSRMLAMGASDDNARALYAADSGIELAIWTLLNDSGFRNAVDASIGTAVPLTTPLSVNGATTSMQVTALPIGAWTELADTPGAIGGGGSLAKLGDYIHALQGAGSTNHWRFNINTDTWSSQVSTPRPVGEGGAMVNADGDIYSFQSYACWFIFCSDPLYELSGSSWVARATHPGADGVFEYDFVAEGSDLVSDGGNFIYAFRGDSSTDFYRYNTNSNGWNTRDDAPAAVGYGGALARGSGNDLFAFRGGNSDDFWQYHGNSWDTSPSDAPGAVGAGGALAGDGGGWVYGLRGNGTTDFWRYNINGDYWQNLAPTPDPVGNGGDLEYAGDNIFYALRGNGSNGFWRFEITPPRYDIEADAGGTSITARVQIDYFNNTAIIFWDIQ